MPDALEGPVLVLNRYFQPVQVTTAKRAFVLLYGGAALAVDGADLYDFDEWSELEPTGEQDTIPTVSGGLRVPRVLHLVRYDRTPRTTVRLSRRNLMLRDGHQCQYCGRRPPLRDLNIDHVIPKCRGGRDAWENLVTTCKTCNLKKGSKAPEEVGFKLLSTPVRPRWTTAARILLGTGMTFPEWVPYLDTG